MYLLFFLLSHHDHIGPGVVVEVVWTRQLTRESLWRFAGLIEGTRLLLARTHKATDIDMSHMPHTHNKIATPMAAPRAARGPSVHPLDLRVLA